MNQFAQLLSAQKQQVLVLDCCTIIAVKNDNPRALEFRKRIANRKDVRIIVPSIAIKEVCKVGKMQFGQAIALVDSFSHTGQIDYVSCNDPEIITQAAALRGKYPLYCHYPDDLYPVIAKKYDGQLITFDRNLQNVADAERVQSCIPSSFRIYQ
jgi:predicted nucleic acid-binding protein